MRVAVLSGKGGAGKTFVAVNLAVTAGATYIDCDVEEPNGRLFLRPEGVTQQVVSVKIPTFDQEKCTGCRKCVEFCQFHALVFLKGLPKVFPDICHHCGGCEIVCPVDAITELDRRVGVVETGHHGDISVVTGCMDLGQVSGIPVIQSALAMGTETTVIDGPPGSACSVMETVQESDYCILVVEPTAFGLHNFQMVHELTVLLGKPAGVVINKAESPYEPLLDYCISHDLPILETFPYDKTLAQSGAKGEIAVEIDKNIQDKFKHIVSQICHPEP